MHYTSGEPLVFDLDGVRLAALAYGPPQGRPVLALHGWLDNAASFATLAPALSECRVVALDLRGHGQSSHNRKPYHIWEGVPDVVAVLNYLGWDQATLLGHSMGAAIATLVAGSFPDRVTALWLLDGFGPWTYPDTEGPDLLRASTLRLLTLGDRKTPVYGSVDEALAVRVAKGVVPLTTDAARPIVERGLVKVANGWRWASDPWLTVPALFRMDETQIQAVIARIAAPVSLALAQDGLFANPGFLDARVKICRSIRVETFPGGHHFHLEGAEGALATWFQTSVEQA